MLPVEDWAHTRDVFLVESAELVQDWATPEGRATKPRRVTRLRGGWAAGSRPRDEARVVYGTPTPDGVDGPDGARYGTGRGEIALDDAEPGVVLLTENRKPTETFAELPVALVPAPPPATALLEAAIRDVAAAAADAATLPMSAALDVLVRRRPRLRNGGALPITGTTIENAVAALTAMDDSYLAVHGPPGSGKSWTGSRVIKELVEKHHWRIGVVGLILSIESGPTLTEKSGPTWSRPRGSGDGAEGVRSGLK
jgi:uncharacterized protein